MGIIEKLNEIIQPQCSKKVIIFGIGYIGIHGLFMLLKQGKQVEYIIDNDSLKWGKEYLGVEVKNPYELIYEDWNNILVFICAGGSRSQEMAALLESMGGVYNKNFFRTLAEERYIPANKINPILGYSRGEENSFKEMMISGQEEKTRGITILILGGSTTDYSLYGIRSWPYFLKQMLHSHNITAKVINGGVCGYYSSQEMLKLLGEGLDKIKPDIVISYSGFNDSLPSQYPLVHDNYVEVLTMLRNCYLQHAGMIDEIYYGQCLNDNIENYLKNMRIMKGICKEFGIRFFGVLQPTMVTGAYMKNDLEKEYLEIDVISAKIKQSLDFYKGVKDKVKKYSWIYDFTDIFDRKKDCFFEWVHCNEYGNQVIAEHIYDVLVKKLTWLYRQTSG